MFTHSLLINVLMPNLAQSLCNLVLSVIIGQGEEFQSSLLLFSLQHCFLNLRMLKNCLRDSIYLRYVVCKEEEQTRGKCLNSAAFVEEKAESQRQEHVWNYLEFSQNYLVHSRAQDPLRQCLLAVWNSAPWSKK